MRHQYKFTNKKWFKNVKLTFYFFIILAMSIALTNVKYGRRGGPPVAEHFAGWIGIVFFGLALLYTIYLKIKYFCQNRQTLMFTDEGLIYKEIFIPWKSITDIYSTDNGVAIRTKRKAKALSKPSPLKKWLLQFNGKSRRPTYHISDFDYDGSQEEFCLKLKERCERASQAASL